MIFRSLFCLKILSILFVLSIHPTSLWASDQPQSSEAESKDNDEGWRLAIEVVDDETGDRLPSPAIEVQFGNGTKHFVGDARGLYRHDFASRNPRVHILASVDGYATLKASWLNGSAVAPDLLPEKFVFRMEKSIVVRGKVVDENGKPVANAIVSLRASGHKVQPGRRSQPILTAKDSTTDNNGFWNCDSVPKNPRGVSIGVKHSDFAIVDNVTVSRLFGKLINGTFVTKLKVGLNVNVRVNDSNGGPVEGAILALGQSSASYAIDGFPTTDADGTYEFKHVRLPSHTSEMGYPVTILKSGFAPQYRIVPGSQNKSSSENSSVAGDNRNRQIEFQLKPGNSVRIKVVDASNKPISGATIYANNWRTMENLKLLRSIGVPTKTDADGIWLWENAPPDERIHYRIDASGFQMVQSHLIVATEPVNNVVIAMKKKNTHWIVGDVTDFHTGEPLAEFAVDQLIKLGSERRLQRWIVFASGKNGEFRKEVLVVPPRIPREQTYRVRADGYEMVSSAMIPLNEGELELTLC